MKPVFQIIADGVDISRKINDRLLLIRTIDKPGASADDFELRIDDRDGAVTLPARGAKMEVSLGYEGQKLTLIGRYTVDEIEVSGPPDTLVVRSKSSDTRSSAKTTRSGSWEGVTLASIVADIAARNGWIPECTVQTIVERADQLSESDLSYITRLAKQYDCTAKVADGKLIVLPRQGGKSASGKTLGVVVIERTDVSRWQFRLGDDNVKKAVKASYQDKKGDLKVVDVGNDDSGAGLPPTHTDRHIHPNKSAAEAAAKARLAGFNRSTAGVRLEMPGRTDLFAEREIDARGFKREIDGRYLVDSVEQVFTQSGWSTTVECNGGKKGKAEAEAKGKKKKGPLKVVDVSN
ncbi:phage late control D family protein [Pseudomonas viridiflava]|uniref:phage late control D family protein n=1 Tax=Pseudomonas viridiflava TaxID=33069 RepID=UPI000F041458|nr:contractile injection system protein, VgrG/Pvc8 family [Pseudomonas viridiflava]